MTYEKIVDNFIIKAKITFNDNKEYEEYINIIKNLEQAFEDLKFVRTQIEETFDKESFTSIVSCNVLDILLSIMFKQSWYIFYDEVKQNSELLEKFKNVSKQYQDLSVNFQDVVSKLKEKTIDNAAKDKIIVEIINDLETDDKKKEYLTKYVEYKKEFEEIVKKG